MTSILLHVLSVTAEHVMQHVHNSQWQYAASKGSQFLHNFTAILKVNIQTCKEMLELQHHMLS